MQTASAIRYFVKEENETAKEHYFTKLKFDSFRSWKLFLLKEYQNKAKILKVREIMQIHMQKKTFEMWTIFHKMSSIKKQMNNLARGCQVKYLCYPILKSWQNRAIVRREKNALKNKAQKNYRECQIVKAFVSLKKEAQMQLIKKELNLKGKTYCTKLRLKHLFNLLKKNALGNIQERLRNETLGHTLEKIIGTHLNSVCKKKILAWVSYTKTIKKLTEIVVKAGKKLKNVVIINKLNIKL